MIRVGHVLPFMGVGGAEQMVLDLCKFRDQAKFDCIVISSQETIMADEIREAGTPVYIGESYYRPAMEWADILNLHCIAYHSDWYEMLRLSGKPYVITLHWLSEMPRLPAITICTSFHTYRIQKDKARFVVIPNGIDLSRFSPRLNGGVHPSKMERQALRKLQASEKLEQNFAQAFSKGLSANTREEVTITRVCRPSRCALYFWTAMYEVLDHYPQARLWIVGNPDHLGKSSDKIRFFGIRRDIPDILAETDIFAYTPCPDSGSMDLVTMEASAMGVPCVVTDVNAVRESVEQGKNGFLVPYGDVDAFVQKVEMLIEDASLRAQMGQTAIRIAQERFDIRRVARSYEAVYEAVLDVYQGH